MKIELILRYFFEIFVKTILPVVLGLAIAGFINLAGIELKGIQKAFIDSLEIGLIVTGLLNFFGLFSFVKLKQKDKFLTFVTENCIHQNCWTGMIDCNDLRVSNKTISIAHPNRNTLSSEAPVLEKYEEIDIIGFGQSRLIEPFSPGELRRNDLVKRLSEGHLKIRILAPRVAEKYFKYSDDSEVAKNQNRFENTNSNSEIEKIIDLVDWYMSIGKELVECLIENNRNHEKCIKIINEAIEVKLHDKPLIPFYMRIKNKIDHSIHFGPYLPEKRSSETITFEISDSKYNVGGKSRNFDELRHYFKQIWGKTESKGAKILLEYYDQLKKCSNNKDQSWENAIS